MFAIVESTNTEPCTEKLFKEGTVVGTSGSRADGASTPALGEKNKEKNR